MKNVLFLILTFISSVLFAQNPIGELKKNYAGDQQQLSKISSFESGGYAKQLKHDGVTPQMFIAKAQEYLGTPYKYGGTSKAGIDCSGLIQATMGDLGIDAPHNAEELARYGKIIINKDDLLPGDVIFFTKTYNTSRLVSHAGFVMEDAKMIHASSSRGVSITKIHNPYYWDKYYLFGARIFSEEEEQAAGQEVVAVAEATTTENKISKMGANVKDKMSGLSGAGKKATLLAAIYDVKRFGKVTESGEKYDKKGLTASHADHPIGTILKVTNPLNDKSVKVRVNDSQTGKGQVKLILSAQAYKELAVKKDAKVKLDVEVIR